MMAIVIHQIINAARRQTKVSQAARSPNTANIPLFERPKSIYISLWKCGMFLGRGCVAVKATVGC